MAAGNAAEEAQTATFADVVAKELAQLGDQNAAGK